MEGEFEAAVVELPLKARLYLLLWLWRWRLRPGRVWWVLSPLGEWRILP